MAYNIFWKIPFKSLRSGKVYTVNIYKDGFLPSGYPLTLKGASQPFFTQEDDDEDIFKAVRTISGYLSIVDDGLAMNANGNTVAFNWRDIIPFTDTDRPVTLTNDSAVLWRGFMQAQNFGFRLYGNPQEKSFPIQCPLTIIEGTDVDYQHHAIENFAYLLNEIINDIPELCRPTGLIVQGGADAREWLMKRIDWQNFVSVDSDGETEARFNLYQCLQEMCRFWGWSARIQANFLYLTCADDSTETNALTLSCGYVGSDLYTLANGTSAGTVGTMLIPKTLTGNIFASNSNNDYQLRGPNKATITADINIADDYVINPFDSKLETEMLTPTWNDGESVNVNDTWVHYTQDVLSVDRYYLEATANGTYGSFAVLSALVPDSGGQYRKIGNVIRIKKSYDSGTVFVSLASKYEHSFHNGFLRITGDVYRAGERYDTTEGRWYSGNADMWMRIGIGKTRNTAMWWNGKEWGSSVVACRLTLGNRNEEMFTRYWDGSQEPGHEAVESNIVEISNLSGRLFIEMLGSNSSVVQDLNGEKMLDIKDFAISFTKNDTVTKQRYPNSGWWDIKPKEQPKDYKYKAKNNNNIHIEFEDTDFFATDDNMVMAYGVIMNNDYSFFDGTTYGGSAVKEKPEQHFANRVTDYWSSSKRKIYTELRYELVDDITPRHKITIDGTTAYPVAISHDWRDDILMLTLIEL